MEKPPFLFTDKNIHKKYAKIKNILYIFNDKLYEWANRWTSELNNELSKELESEIRSSPGGRCGCAWKAANDDVFSHSTARGKSGWCGLCQDVPPPPVAIYPCLPIGYLVDNMLTHAV